MMKSVPELLYALGASADEVAYRLHRLGITGYAGKGHGCPVAVYLRRNGHGYCQVFADHVYDENSPIWAIQRVTADGGDYNCIRMNVENARKGTWQTTAAVREFIQRFDAGCYRMLHADYDRILREASAFLACSGSVGTKPSLAKALDVPSSGLEVPAPSE